MKRQSVRVCTWNSGVIKSTLCPARLTGSLVSEDLTHSRIISCRHKRDDWVRQRGSKVGLRAHTEEDVDKKVRLNPLSPFPPTLVLTGCYLVWQTIVGVYLLPRWRLLPAVKASPHFNSLTGAETDRETELVFWRCAALQGHNSTCVQCLLMNCQIQFPQRTSSTSCPHCYSLQKGRTWLKHAHRAGDELTGCDPTVRKSLRPKCTISLGGRGAMWRAQSASVSEIMQYDVWKKLIKDKKCWRHDGLQLTANYWSHFVSLRHLMGVNISYILLHDLLVFKGAHPCLTKPHGTPRDTCRSVSSRVHCWGKTSPEGFHFKAKELTPGHQERPHRTERKLLFSLTNSLPSCWVSRVNSPDQRTHWGLTQEVKGWTICQYPKICVF